MTDTASETRLTLREAGAVLGLAPDDLRCLISAGPFSPIDGKTMTLRQVVGCHVAVQLSGFPATETIAIAALVAAEARPGGERVLLVDWDGDSRISAAWWDGRTKPESRPELVIFADKILDDLADALAEHREATRRLN